MIKIEKLNKPRAKVKDSHKLALIGLTPGMQQHTKINLSVNAREGAFAGTMRTNLFRYFNDLKINSYFNLKDKDQMFNDRKFDDLVFITSMLRDPVYIIKNSKKKNYSGHFPKPWKSKLLMEEYVKTINILKELPKD